jgi:Peptidyl-prolyl cis-trans isomerase (rotamase) - cyclophilin family
MLFFCVIYTVYSQQNKETMVLIKTNMGDIKIKLYNATPKHRDNFIKLVSNKYYDSLLFHRVIKDFMIQTGDPNSKHATKTTQLGSGGPNYQIPAEFNAELVHKKGALAAARSGDEVNPLKASSGSQFYIVVGEKYDDNGLNQVETKLNGNRKKNQFREYLSKPENKALKNEIAKYQKAGNKVKLDSIGQIVTKRIDEYYKNEPAIKFTDYQRNIYKTIGGTPFLDMNYTVFGEVVEGLDVVDKIASVETLQGNRPVSDVLIISASVVKE